jgi:hypothetical protein
MSDYFHRKHSFLYLSLSSRASYLYLVVSPHHPNLDSMDSIFAMNPMTLTLVDLPITSVNSSLPFNNFFQHECFEDYSKIMF